MVSGLETGLDDEAVNAAVAIREGVDEGEGRDRAGDNRFDVVGEHPCRPRHPAGHQ